MVRRILVATDRSDTATRAVEWAADMAERYSAELLLLQVVLPEHAVAGAEDGAGLEEELAAFGQRIAGVRGRARLVVDSDPSDAIVRVADEERVDIVVVGNVGMSDRREFLLGSVPNRVSHNARCSVVIVNTLGDAVRRPAREPVDSTEPVTEGQLLRRAARIARVITKYGLREVLSRGGERDASEATRARRFRDALQELGPTFAKLGQILSTRSDLLPEAFIEELATLQDRVTPLTEEEVVAVMEQELRVPWEDVFQSLEPDPMAAGTIAQVHRAVLASGDRVVVKVQRPNAGQDILRDIGLLERFGARAAERATFQQVVDLPAIIEHLSSSLRRELDFRQEAQSIERMRAVLEPFDRLAVPRVYRDLSTSRLLVMEEVQGVPIRQAPQGEVRSQAARQLLESYYQQVLADGFFHGDPHPGNLMWWNDRIYFLDLGMIGEVEPELRENLLLLLLAFWQEDITFLAEIMLLLSEQRPGPDFDKEGFTTELGALVSQYRRLALQELRLGPLLQQLTGIAVRHRLRLPASLALMGKAFGQMQLATAELDPSLDPFAVVGTFFLRRLVAQVRGAANPQRLFYESQKLRVRLNALLEGLERLTGARPGPALQIDFQGTHRLESAIGRAARRVALAFAAATALVATAVTAGSGNVAGWVTPTLGSADAILISGLLLDIMRHRE